MMSYDKYERRCQHLNGGHQRITYKNILTLQLTKSNKWVGVGHSVQIHSLNSPPMTSSVEKKNNNSEDDDINDNDKEK